jgi:peptidoglycan/LPS O-acetylase OafA/YrhL
MRQHFDVLDGLRGTAALVIVASHLLEAIFPNYVANPLRHAYLAVDFFFLLSGFVVSYAYDARWPTLRVQDFFRLRLIRLHPLVLLSAVIGGLCYWFDPFVGESQHVRGLLLGTCLVLGSMLLPAPGLPNRADLTHSLNAPGWSLMQQYLANIAYALVGRRLSRRSLQLVVAAAAIALTVTAISRWSVQGGWSWASWWLAPIRVTFSFSAGLLLCRQGLRLHLRLPATYLWLSLLLLLIFAAPASRINGLYEASCIIVVFPLIVAVGVGAGSAGRLNGLCRFLGNLSYPLYLVHFPFVQIFAHWLAVAHPSPTNIMVVACALSLFFVALAWAALRWYDEPIRAWLGTRNQQVSVQQLHTA